MHKRNEIGFFFLMQFLKNCITSTKKVVLDLKRSKYLYISKAIFQNVPDKCLFEQSPMELYKSNSNSTHWFMLLPTLTFLFPEYRMELRTGYIEPPSDDEQEDFLDNMFVTTTV